MTPELELNSLLRQHKFTLVRRRKHLVYETPDGKILVVSATPSDHRAHRKAISDLRRVVANPKPSSALLEEEKQRRELEKFIVLNAKSKSTAGASGAGRKSNGSGIGYELIVLPELTDEMKEQSRKAAARSELIEKASGELRTFRKNFIESMREVLTEDIRDSVHEVNPLENIEKWRGESIAEHGYNPDDIMTAQEIIDYSVKRALREELPGLMKQVKKIAGLFWYEIDLDGKTTFFLPRRECFEKEESGFDPHLVDLYIWRMNIPDESGEQQEISEVQQEA